MTVGGSKIFLSVGSSSSLHLRSPGVAAVESVAPGAQGGLFWNGDGFVRWGDTSTGVGQPHGNAGRCKPGSGAGETEEEVGRSAARMRREGLVKGQEVGDGVVDSCTQKLG